MKRLGPSTFSQNVWNFIGAAALALGVIGCGNGDSGGTGGAGTGGTTCDVPMIFKQTNANCTIAGCHSANAPAAGFDMTAPGWEKAMVGKMPPGGGPMNATSMCAGMNRTYLVAGSQPATGLFLDKIRPNPPCGARMPNLPLLELTTAEIACVQEWANALTKP
jgi:hypothetical protein